MFSNRRMVFHQLIRIHDRFCAAYDAACRRRCAACCTDQVIVTTLEGLVLLESLNQEGPTDWRQRLRRAAALELHRPRLTINQWAEQCLKDNASEVPAEMPPATPCPFLSEQICPIYAARPLACRAMLSRATCSPEGAAEMPDEVLAFNTVLMQYLEAIDQPGLTGNLIDILVYLDHPTQRRDYLSGRLDTAPGHLLHNHPLPALMVPPELYDRLQPVIREVKAAIHGRPPGNQD